MYDYQNKQTNILMMNTNMLNKSLGMFEYEGLPDSIPSIEIEKRLQNNGYAFIYEYNGELYVFDGSFSGEVDMYGQPTEININNLYLKLNKTVPLKDGVLLRNDDYMTGLIPIYEKYNSIMNENEITMMMNNFSNRMQQFMSVGDDKTKASAEKFVKDIIKGELGVIAESQVFDGLKNHTQNTNGVSSLDLIEFQQYMKASLYNEIGIDLNFNMKRERLTSGEVSQNSDILFPLTNSMHRNRVTGLAEVNKKYGLDITVHYGSIWVEREIKDIEGNEEDEYISKSVEIIDESTETDTTEGVE